MSTICKYNCIVKGRKNACYAVYGSMRFQDYKEIISGSGTDDNYELLFTGTCKFSIDFSCTEIENPVPFEIPQDINEAERFGKSNCFIPQYQKPILFGVELYFNSAVIDDYDLEIYDECGGDYVHYAKDGSYIDDMCPEEIY